MIALKKITKKYGKGENEFLALKGIDLEISKGEFVAIMGSSGSGKSTLMNIIGALDVPTSGVYKLNKKKVSKMSDNQLADLRNNEIGFIFQQFNLLPRTSVFNNVALPGKYAGLKNLNKKVRRILKSMEILDKIDKHPNQLSVGQIQRVAIARALIMEPSIILADEPTGNLDTKTGIAIMKLFKNLHEEGHTIVVITHEDEIAAYARRIVLLKDGLVMSDKIYE